ncbi:uncharacterized protein LOC132755669 [Ruditapes philippinarum]|uniref:uncharacterized protein LOC132755669 n=1 Tax=Ruditapes philippinarum TaxID=129788 RepID=UPI00295C0E24|nr:uncharacterized protein LOC132755669 [Ruditapes philippinarum]
MHGLHRKVKRMDSAMGNFITGTGGDRSYLHKHDNQKLEEFNDTDWLMPLAIFIIKQAGLLLHVKDDDIQYNDWMIPVFCIGLGLLILCCIIGCYRTCKKNHR